MSTLPLSLGDESSHAANAIVSTRKQKRSILSDSVIGARPFNSLGLNSLIDLRITNTTVVDGAQEGSIALRRLSENLVCHDAGHIR